MPVRLIREGIITSEAVNKLSWAAEVFYRRLLNKVDDFGRYDGRIPILVGEMYALKRNKVSDADVSSWLAECEKAGLVSRYIAGSQQCVVVHKFKQKVRAKASKWPDPPADVSRCAQMLADVHLDEGADGDEGADVSRADRNPPHTWLDDLWAKAPDRARRRSSRKDVATAWEKVKPKPDPQAVLDGMDAWKRSEDWAKNDGEFIPGLHRWLKKRKWEELPQAQAQDRSGLNPCLSMPAEEVRRMMQDCGLIKEDAVA